MGSLARIWRFTWVMAPPHIVFTYGLLWVLALEGSAALLSSTGGGWSPSWDTVARLVTVVLTLIFMRMLDEQKDLEYDRVHHPDRPLVTGAISAGELRASMVVIAAVVAALNVLISVASLVLILAVLAYGLALFALERMSQAIRDGLVVNVFVTYPVQLILSLYLYVSLATSGAITADWRVIPLVAIFACAFLHFEFARKTAWTASQGERLYSSVLGPRASAVICLALGIGASVFELVAFEPWQAANGMLALLPLLMVAFPLHGAQRFFARASNAWPSVLAMLFILGTYLALVAQAAQAL